jgi:BMFP domain-containing protein YqiC|tara:strand:+ start:955 stop:1200 length:246 start_codon:yes stop_codon:yes gene_type:complete
MNSSKKILELISSFVEKGILTTEDIRKEFFTELKFKKDNLIDKLQLVSREEFNILKKIVLKQEKKIQTLEKRKNTKKVKKS